MPPRSAGTLARNPVVLTFLFLAIILFLHWSAEVVKPVVLALLIAFVLAPAVRYLERRGTPRILAVVLTVLMTAGLLGGAVYVVGRQLTTLVERLPAYEETILQKIQFLRSSEPNVVAQASEVVERVAKSIDTPAEPDVVKVRVIEQPWMPQRIGSAIAPYLEFLASGLVVVVLVIFLLAKPEDLTARVIRLVGQDRISLTMQTLNEVGERISRYLASFAAVNAVTGLAAGFGLWAIGLEFAALWGAFSALFRFVPYVGPAVAFACPILFATASTEGWTQPLLAIAVLATIEILNDMVIEPLVYGKSAGISPLGLLVAALFWTWIWGALGLLLSTALTVSMTVLGKSVRSLRFLDVLFSEEAGLDEDVKFYQRLLAQDEDEALEALEGAIQKQGPGAAFDGLLVPALARARRDVDRDFLDERDRVYINRVVGDMLDEAAGPDPDRGPPGPASSVAGVGVRGDEDVLALEMLGRLLAANGTPLVIAGEGESALGMAERVAELAPEIIIVSHIPPGGVVQTRYLVRKLRSQFPGVPILVGFWGRTAGPEAAEKVKRAGATALASSLREAAAWVAQHSAGAEPAAECPGPRNGSKGNAPVKA
jgi:predicted PurR-regulated permease PerM